MDPPTGGRPYGRLFDGRDQFPGFAAAGTDDTTTVALPEEWLDTTPPDDTGWPVIRPTNRVELYAAVTAHGAGNGVIELPPGFDVSEADIPARPFTAEGVRPETIIWIRPQTPPEGFPAPANLITPSVGEQCPTFRAVNAGGGRALSFMQGIYSYGFRVTGVRFLQAASTSTEALVRTHRDSRGIVFDRCYGRARDAWTNCRRGIWLDGGHHAVIDSWLHDFKDASTDSQAVGHFSGTGAIKLVGNVLEAGGEPFMVGGLDPFDGNNPDLRYQPRDIECRRNLCRKKQRWNRKHPHFADEARVQRGPFPVAGFDAATKVLTISAGAFASSESMDVSGSYRYYYLAYVTSGPGAGGWNAIQTYTNGTTVVMRDAAWTQGAPDATSQIEVRYQTYWVGKNCLELKNGRRVYFAELVLENSWDGDDSQPFAVNFKTADQGGTADYIWTTDVTMVDSVVLNVYGGIFTSPRPGNKGIPARRIHFDNLLIVPSLNPAYYGGNGNRHTPIWIATDETSVSRITSRSYTYGMMYLAFDSRGATARLDRLRVSRLLASHSTHSITGNAEGSGFVSGVNAVSGAVDTATLLWRNNGIAGTASSTRYPNGATPAPGPWSTRFTVDPDPWVNSRAQDWPVVDWSLKASDPLAQVPGDERPGCDWPGLAARISGVRPPLALLPMEW